MDARKWIKRRDKREVVRISGWKEKRWKKVNETEDDEEME